MGACWIRQHCLCTTSILQGIYSLEDADEYDERRNKDLDKWGWWPCLKGVGPWGDSAQQCWGAVHISPGQHNTTYTDILPCKYVQSFCQIGVVHHNGHFVYVIAVHSKSACSPNFEGFPWGMQVNLVYLLRTKLDRNHPVRFAVFSLVLGSTVSMEWSTDCLETAPLVSQISNKLLAGRSWLESSPDIPMYLIWAGGEHKV